MLGTPSEVCQTVVAEELVVVQGPLGTDNTDAPVAAVGGVLEMREKLISIGIGLNLIRRHGRHVVDGEAIPEELASRMAHMIEVENGTIYDIYLLDVHCNEFPVYCIAMVGRTECDRMSKVVAWETPGPMLQALKRKLEGVSVTLN